MPSLPAVTPKRFLALSYASLGALSVIVLTGAAVRLTDSGLGCPDWPRCYGRAVPPLSFHSLIEYGNRIFSALIGLLVLATFIAALRRSPRRRDLTWIAALPPLGCLAQGGVGALTVQNHLAPGFVMTHFGLSMLILVAAVALVFRARIPDDEVGRRAAVNDWLVVWLVRLLVVLGAAAIFGGMVATASGPHAGADDGQLVHRLHFKGAETLVWVIHRHAILATMLGLGVILAWFLARRRGASPALIESLTVAGVLMAAQGLIGSVQYGLELPADLVWVHVTLATATWITLLWCVGVAGRPAPRGARPPAAAPSDDRLSADSEPLARAAQR